MVGGWIYTITGGELAPMRLDWMLLPPIAVSILSYFLVNSALTAGVIAATLTSWFMNVWDINYRWLTPNYIGLGLVGFGMAVAVQSVGLLGLTIF